MASGSMVAALYAKLSMDTKGFDKGVKDAAKGMEVLEDQTKSTSEAIADSRKKMKMMGAAAMGAGTLILGFMKSAANSVSDLDEAINVAGLTFKESKGEMLKWSEAAADTMGQSQRGALEAAAQIGGLLNNMGMAGDETVQWSKDLVELGADMGSAFNKDPARAVQAIGAALRGESEPIRAFNVMLDDASVRAKAVELGLAATTAEVDYYGLAQGRLALIMEQTSDIQGDFVNTSDGLANAQRVLASKIEEARAALGTSMLPVMEAAVGMAIDAVDAFQEFNEQTDGLAGKLLVFAGAASVAVGAILLLSAGVNAAMAQLVLINPWFAAFVAVSALAVVAIGTIIKAKGEWKDEMAAARDELVKFNPELGKATAYLEEMAAALPDVSDPLSTLTDIVSSFAGEAILVQKAVDAGLGDAMKALQKEGIDLEKVMEKDLSALGKLADAFDNDADIVGHFGTMTSEMSDEGKAAAQVFLDLHKAKDLDAKSMSTLIDIMGETSDVIGAVNAETEESAAAFLDSNDALRLITETLHMGGPALVDYLKKLEDAREGEGSAAEAAKILAADIEEVTLATHFASAEFGSMSGVIDPATESAAELAEALAGVIGHLRELADMALAQIDIEAAVRKSVGDVDEGAVALGFALKGKDSDGKAIKGKAEAAENLNKTTEEYAALLKKAGDLETKSLKNRLKLMFTMSETEIEALTIAQDRQNLLDTYNKLMEAGVDVDDARVVATLEGIALLDGAWAGALSNVHEASKSTVFFDYQFRLIGGIPDLPSMLTGTGTILEPQEDGPSATKREQVLIDERNTSTLEILDVMSGNAFDNSVDE